jgi:hypothetical protein
MLGKRPQQTVSEMLRSWKVGRRDGGVGVFSNDPPLCLCHIEKTKTSIESELPELGDPHAINFSDSDPLSSTRLEFN